MGTQLPKIGNLSNLDNCAGLKQLLEDLTVLMEDTVASDVIFIVGREEIRFYSHKLILKIRCKSVFDSSGEACTIPGSIVTPGSLHTTIRLPKYQPNIFQQVLLYIYTGKVALNDTDLFEVYVVAHDLGLKDLCQYCYDHLNGTMTPFNACTFLSAALCMENKIAGINGDSFINRIINYIGENALECIFSNSFLNLTREAIIKLISSDNLAIEEENVWRGVLHWAKYKAGVNQPTNHWTEEEKLRVCHHLHGVINHVRLLLIDSKVFAEEVEPTGAVPMELSLERYRFAALPDKYRENSTVSEAKKLQPRLQLKFFDGSQILTEDKACFQRTLNNWYGEPKQVWKLAYRASTHGFSAEAFHRHCDGIAPTFTIVMGEHGEVCGGFSDVPWNKSSYNGKYATSENSFLFTLINRTGLPPTKYPVVKKMFAICYHSDCGPIFGAGADLLISNKCNQNSDSYSNLPHSYASENTPMTPHSCGDENTPVVPLMGVYNFRVFDYEVFTL